MVSPIARAGEGLQVQAIGISALVGTSKGLFPLEGMPTVGGAGVRPEFTRHPGAT
jgi:hypothetical protein